jgi:hypothetical protein
VIADDDPRLRIPGPPGGERYLCPLTVDGRPCPWYLDVPAPEVELRPAVAGPGYVLVSLEVQVRAVEVAVVAHLREHDPAELSAAVRAVLRHA